MTEEIKEQPEPQNYVEKSPPHEDQPEPVSDKKENP